MDQQLAFFLLLVATCFGGLFASGNSRPCCWRRVTQRRRTQPANDSIEQRVRALETVVADREFELNEKFRRL